MDILALAQSKTQLKKTASTHGGEWVGPCPSCGGRDRFHVWPDKTDSKRSDRRGIYWCRSCGKSGDVVQFLVDFDGKGYPEALAAVGIEAQPSTTKYRPPAVPGARRPSQPAAPCKLKNDVQAQEIAVWQKKAGALVEHAAAALAENDHILTWLHKRGIPKQQADALKLGWLADGRWRHRASWGLAPLQKEDGSEKKLWIPAGLVIPMISGDAVRRIRIRRFGDQEPRYYVLPGSSMAGMSFGLPQRAAVIVESELDAIMLAGQVGDFCGVVAMGSSSAKPDRELVESALSKCAVILVALDCDEAGAKACAWWTSQFPQAKRWPVPAAKDPGDAFAAGVSMVDWIKAGLPAAWFFGPEPVGQIARRGPAEKDQVEPVAVKPVVKVVSPVDELAGLLRQHPVSVRIAPGGSRVWIRENTSWARQNWETSRRISQLVFRPEVLDYLWSLGVEVVDGKNIVAS